jgi:hypothetical protein
MTIGTNDIKIDRATAGKRPVTTPMIIEGILSSHVKKEMVLR